MSLRIVTPAGGTAGVSFIWDNGEIDMPAGTVLDVAEGSELEQAIGTDSLTPMTGQQLASLANGGGGNAWTHN